MLKNIIKRHREKRFNAWQIEITTRCPLRCIMCVRQAGEMSKQKDMDIKDFKKIVPYLKDVNSVVLEGWGESLLHKDLIEIIGLIKEKGTRVGFVTSGFGLNRYYIDRLTGTRIDFIGFSLSGARPETHNSIRVNSDFERLIESIKYIAKRDDYKPRMHIAYLLLKENVYEVPLLVELAAEIGINQIILLNLIQISNEGQNNSKVFTYERVSPYLEILNDAKRKAERLKIDLIVPRVSPQEVTVCSENPLRNLYISVDGEVSPCVYLYPPVSSPFNRIFCGEKRSVKRLSFGNIFETNMEEIWNSKQYMAFRKFFFEREKATKRLYEHLFEMKMFDKYTYPDAPEVCKTCHKMLGF